MITKTLASNWISTGSAVALFIISCSSALSQILVPVQDQSLVDPQIQVDVQFDVSTDLYTYNYTVTNGANAAQEIWSFAIEADADISNIQSPPGWSSGQFSDQPILSWGATDLTGVEAPLPEVDDGNIGSSLFNILPGATLSGFSFQSSEASSFVNFYAQGFAKLPMAVSEDDFDGIEFPHYTENSLVGTTLGPGLSNDIIFTGGRRPSVDGFLGFVGVVNRETLTAPITLLIRFAVNGEQVNVASFQAALNGTDVTARFEPAGSNNEMIALFDLADESLIVGRNVLLTSVEGLVPGTTRIAKDSDRLTIFIQ